ncbi:MAG: type I methionyl aminopeptidase [Patescibacteria group bacterium]
MVRPKTDQEIELMAKSGAITAYALRRVLDAIDANISLLELDALAESCILEKGGAPSFKTVDDYSYTTCINVNDGIVHGLPNKYRLKEGDLVSIDLGTVYKGYHSDVSYTVEVGTSKEAAFLNTGLTALEAGISKLRVGKRLGDVGNAIQTIVENAGYTVSEDLVGHGIGTEVHEPPYVPGYGTPNTGLKLKAGMVFAIEVIYQKGEPDIVILDDNWTIATKDGSLSGLFEQTVVVTKHGPKILTPFI